MANITSREDLINYCLRQLGAPVIRIDVHPDQISDRIDDALALFTNKHYNAVEPKWFVHRITDDDVNNGYIETPDSVTGVLGVRCQFTAGGSGVFSATYQIMLEDYMGRSGAFSVVGVTDFYLTQRHITLINELFSPRTRFNFNKTTNRLFVFGVNLQDLKESGTPIIINWNEKVIDSNGAVGNFWADNWLRKYATALIKKQWGNNLKKFNNVQLIGGTVLNGQAIYDEAEAECKELEQELESSYEEPVDFMIG